MTQDGFELIVWNIVLKLLVRTITTDLKTFFDNYELLKKENKTKLLWKVQMQALYISQNVPE